MNLADAIRAHARERPEHPALEHLGRAIGYAAFDRAVDAAAAALEAKGIRRGEHVGIGLSDRPAHLAYLFGAARLGAAFVPIDCRWTPGEKERVCASFAVKLAVLDEGEAPGAAATLFVPLDWPLRDSHAARPGVFHDRAGDSDSK